MAARDAEARDVPIVPVTFCCAGATAWVGEGDADGAAGGAADWGEVDAGEVIVTLSSAVVSALLPLMVTV